jgi:hypothetical protein
MTRQNSEAVAVARKTYSHYRNGMTRSEYFKAHPELYQELMKAGEKYKHSPEGKVNLAQHARRLNAMGVMGRKTPVTDAERLAQSERMRRDNPMKRPEIREKRRHLSDKRKQDLREQCRRLYAMGLFGHPPPMTEETKEAHRQRMRQNNPMKNPETRLKVSRAIQAQYKEDRCSMVKRWVNAGNAPNKAESMLAEIITPMGFQFTGGGQFWIGPCQSGRCRNPDFVYGTGREKIALLLNGEYWHSLPKSDDEAAMTDYSELGWQVFVVTDKELIQPTVKTRIMDWLSRAKRSNRL